jgi:pyridoxal phosphate enzyme (YggS family)
MTIIAHRLQVVRARIEQAARHAGRSPEEVRLLAVSKTFPAIAVREAFAEGQRAFGENYVQEALAKMDDLRDLPLEWHYIGPIQSNKTRSIAERFHWVHSVDRLKIAQRLSETRPVPAPPLEICIQVNVSGETTKSGVAPDEALHLANEIARLPRLRLRGLMTIPEPTGDRLLQHAHFSALRDLKDRIQSHGIDLDTLSMGMTDDLEAAIEEGATIVRVGRAVFGERARKA